MAKGSRPEEHVSRPRELSGWESGKTRTAPAAGRLRLTLGEGTPREGPGRLGGHSGVFTRVSPISPPPGHVSADEAEAKDGKTRKFTWLPRQPAT